MTVIDRDEFNKWKESRSSALPNPTDFDAWVAATAAERARWTAGWQWQDKHGQVFHIEDLTRDDLLQVACNCMQAIEEAEEACAAQQKIFTAWRTGRKVDA